MRAARQLSPTWALDTRLIQDFLGHASIANTVRYTKLAPGRLLPSGSDSHTAVAPGANMTAKQPGGRTRKGSCGIGPVMGLDGGKNGFSTAWT